MPTELRGLSEPGYRSRNILKLGTIAKMVVGNNPFRMMISALIRDQNGAGPVYLLLTPHSRMPKGIDGAICSVTVGRNQRPLGKLVSTDVILADTRQEFGFRLVKMDATPLFANTGEGAAQLVTTRNFRDNLWRVGDFKLRQVNPYYNSSAEGITRKNRHAALTNKMGIVAGEIFHTEIEDQEQTLVFPYLGLVTRGQGKPLARDATGAPVISRSGALSGFIVGQTDDETLVLPVEKFPIKPDMRFVTFGEDWPKVRVSV